MGFLSELFRNQYPLVDQAIVHVFAREPRAPDQRVLPPVDAPRPAVSLVATVKNEAGTIGAWLDSIEAQSRLPEEIVIVDGGSTDETWPVVQARAQQAVMPMKVLQRAGANIARGRNLAIEAAAGPIIACADAGCVLDQDWLANLTAPFAGDAAIEVSAGYYRAAVATDLQRAMAAYLVPPIDWVDPQSFLPSARSLAFRKEAWARTRGFPEWLTLTAEDTLFAVQLKGVTRQWAFVPEAQVAWRLKPTLGQLFRQVRTYARGDGEAGLFPEVYRRQLDMSLGLAWKATLGAAGLLLAIAARSAASLAAGLAALALLALQLHRMTLRLRGISGAGRRARALALSALVAAIIPIAMSIGFIQGVRSRVKRAARPTPVHNAVGTGQ